MSRRKLISSDQATPAPKQLVQPCSDCPWARAALNGWLGSNTAEEWLQMAHGETHIECHVHPNVQCAGASIYRANVGKRPRDPSLLRLPSDRDTVFGTPSEFREHHAKRPEKQKPSGAVDAAFCEIRDKLDEVSDPSRLNKMEYLELLNVISVDIEMRIEATRREMEESEEDA